MTIEQLARAFNARGSGKRIRAKCPVHKSRSLTLAIYDDGDRLSVHCHAGCKSDDVLAAVGLSWRDLVPQKETLSPAEFRKQQREREAGELKESNLRIGKWILRFIDKGYSTADREQDVRGVLAATWVLVNKEVTQWRIIFNTHWERIQAANHCEERGIKMATKAELVEWAQSFSGDLLPELVAEAMAYRKIRTSRTIEELKGAFVEAVKAAKLAKDEELLNSFMALKDARKAELTK